MCDSQTILTVPDFMGQKERQVEIDTCLVPLMKHLWEHGIVTRFCCCGHGVKYQHPYIAVDDNQSVDDLRHLEDIIAIVDDREFRLCSRQVSWIEINEDCWHLEVKG